MSIEGGLQHAVLRAVACGFNCVQVFTHSPRVWAERPASSEEIGECVRLADMHDIKPIVVHAAYLPNLASPDDALWRKSIAAVENDLRLCDALHATSFVLHPGSARGMGVAYGIERIAAAFGDIVSRFLPRTTLLLENAVGTGSTVGSTLEQLDDLCKAVEAACPAMRVGVCLDTAHLFATGFDLRRAADVQALVAGIERTVGMRRIQLLHCNDSHGALGSNRDHHAHIGRGTIGLAGFRNMMKIAAFRRLPWILETPKDDDASDLMNGKTIQRLFRQTDGR